jgi:hypothetical protein
MIKERTAPNAREEEEKLTGHVIPANRLCVARRLLVLSLCHHRVPVLMGGCTGEESATVPCGRGT